MSELLTRIAATDEGGAEARAGARSALGRVFGREPISTATIAVMHHVDGMTLQEVADAVGLSVSGVRKRLRKVKALAGDLRSEVAA